MNIVSVDSYRIFYLRIHFISLFQYFNVIRFSFVPYFVYAQSSIGVCLLCLEMLCPRNASDNTVILECCVEQVESQLDITEHILFFQTDYTEDCADTKPDRDIELELSALDTDEPDGQGEQIEVSTDIYASKEVTGSFR